MANPSLIEFPADDAERARRFWAGILGAELEARTDGEGEGWQTRGDSLSVGVHERGPGPGDTVSLPYFAVADLPAALERVSELGGSVITPVSAGRSAGTPRAVPSASPPTADETAECSSPSASLLRPCTHEHRHPRC